MQTLLYSRKKIVGHLLLVILLLPALAHATALSELAASLQPGTVGILNQDGDGSGLTRELLNTGVDTILNYSDKAQWNPRDNKIYYIGQGHQEAQKFITYSEQSNTWQLEAVPPWTCQGTSCIGHGYQHNALNPVTGDFFFSRFNSNDIHRLQFSTSSWGASPFTSIPGNFNTVCCKGVAYYNELGGLIVISGGSINLFSVGTSSWTPLDTKPMAEYHNVAVYNPVHKIVVGGGGETENSTEGEDRLYKIETNGVVTPIAFEPISVAIYKSIFTVDPVSGNYLLFAPGNIFYEYNVANDEWLQFDGSVIPFLSEDILHTIAVSIIDHGVVMFVRYNNGSPISYVYKHSSGDGMPIDRIPPVVPAGVSVQ